MSAKRTLYVKKTSTVELTKEWGFNPVLLSNGDIYIQCSAKGIVNWEGCVYQAKELVGRDKVVVF